MTKTRMTSVMMAIAVVASACSSSSSPTTPAVTATQTITTDILTGTVPAAVNGVMQSAFNQFVVGQGGGSVTVTLTSAIETLPDNSYESNVTMGLGAGTVVNGACTLFAGTSLVQTQPSVTNLGGTLTAGTYCVLVQDVTGQLGPVAYSVSVSHP